MEYDLQRLKDFKAEFENLAESSIDDNESDRTHGGGGGGSGGAGESAADSGEEKWKLRAKKLQKYVKWQLAEVANQVRHALAESNFQP